MAFRASGAKIGVQINNPFEHVFRDFFARAEDAYTARENVMLIKLNEKILANTPVWEGDTILNWRWSTRMPDLRHEEARGIGIEPGPTNTMPLGSEPRRRINEERPRRSLAGALKAKKPVDIYLTNTSDSAQGLEYGLLPTPERSRVDGGKGIVRLAIAEVMAGVL
jgi:hypothetical protein